MNTILTIFVFILGASMGSFLSVMTYRISKKKSGIVLGHSMCPHCKKKLRSVDLVPLLSYLMLRGKCRYCQKKIPPRYFYLELLTAFTFIAIFFRFPFMDENASLDYGYTIDSALLLNFFLYLIYSIFLIAIFFYDLEHSEIPDLFLFPFIGIALIGSFVLGNPDSINMVIAIGISVLFFGGQIFISKGKWLGDGDLYLALALSIIFSWKMLLVAIVFSYTIGAIISTFLLLMKKANGKSQIPFAPFMVLGSFVTIFFGEEIINWYLSSLTI